MLGVDLEGEGLLFFVAQDGDLHGLAHVGAEIAVPVGEVVMESEPTLRMTSKA
jgi:hypothetical protein